MKGHRLAKLQSILVITVLLVCAGAVGCGPTAGSLPQPPPGGPLPGEEVPGGPGPGGELQLVLVANPDMVPPGGCAMLHWEVSPPGEFRVLLNGQEVPLVGDQQVCPPGTTTYELLVETPGGPQVRTLTVNVGGGPGGGPLPPTPGGGPEQPPTPGLGPPPTAGPAEGCAGAPTFTYFTASATSISAGQQVQLSWGEVRNGTSGPLVGSVVLSPGGFGEVGSPGSRWASPTTTTTYRLTATGCGGTATKDVTVTVGGAGAVATATPHPGGPTATTQTSGPTATPTIFILTVVPMQPYPTATPTVKILATFIAIPAPTATPVPVWDTCGWETVGTAKSFDGFSCSEGTFLTGLDLDRYPLDDVGWRSPIVGQMRCCSLPGASSNWGTCGWWQIENSHQTEPWCPDGAYLTGFKLQKGWGEEFEFDYPIVYWVRCCRLAQYSGGSALCSWEGVENAGIDCHEAETWCPNGSFMAGLDQDSADIDPMDSPVVGKVYCCQP